MKLGHKKPKLDFTRVKKVFAQGRMECRSWELKLESRITERGLKDADCSRCLRQRPASLRASVPFCGKCLWRGIPETISGDFASLVFVMRRTIRQFLRRDSSVD